MFGQIRREVSQEIMDTISNIPQAIASLICDYYRAEDLIELAQEPIKLKFNPHVRYGSGQEIEIRNPEVPMAIKECLGFSECDPKIKSILVRRFVSEIENRKLTLNYVSVDRSEIYNQTEQLKKFSTRLFRTILNQMHDENRVLNLNNVDLHGLDMSRLNLSQMTALGANFEACLFLGTNLSFAEMTNANLSRAQLHRADLTGAILLSADLRSADLSNATLRYANLTKARFQQTYLSHSKADETDVTGVITNDKSLQNFLEKFKKRSAPDVIVRGNVYLSFVLKTR